MTFEDICALTVLAQLLLLMGGLEPCPRGAAPPAYAAAARTSASSDDGGAAAPDALPPRGAPPPPSLLSRCAAFALAFSRLLLLAAAFAAAFIAMFVMGALGGPFPVSLDSAQMWQRPALSVVAPFLAIVALSICAAGYNSVRAGEAARYGALLAAALAYHFVALSISKGAPPAAAAGCEKLVFHPHHYALSFFCVLLLRNHGLTRGAGALRTLAGVAVYIVKAALIGVFIQGITQYGADSILRRTTCAKT